MRSVVPRGWSFTTVGRLILATLAIAVQALAADIGDTKTFDIKPKAMDQALIEFSKQAGFQVLSDSASVGKFQTKGVSGSRTVAAALEELLAGSGLSFRVVG